MQFGSFRSLLFSIMFLLPWTATHSQSFPVVINEVMSSNLNTIADEDGDYEDWIELHNRGDEPVNLEGWGLSDDDFNAFKWVFPDVTIGPDEYLMVWASGKNRLEGELHTNFSISSDGEPVLLSHPEQGVIQFVPAVPIPGQVSYGLNPDQPGFFYYSNPTPGAPNTTKAYAEILNAEPFFSHTGGFYTEPFELTISTDIPGATIYYTLDGSEPNPDNLDGTNYQYKNRYPHGEFLTREVRTFRYEEPLYIYDRSAEPYELAGINSRFTSEPHLPPSNMFKGIPVRAIIKKEGTLTPNPTTHTYFVTPEGGERFSLPVISMVTDERNLFDYERGIYVAGKIADDSYNQNSTWSVWSPTNYNRRGTEWERPNNFEYFSNKSDNTVNRTVGIRIHGAASRHSPLKSFRIYARSSYSSNEITFFNDWEESIQTKRRMILRNSGQDLFHTMFRDAAIQNIVKGLNFDTQAYNPSNVFINGEYWGILNMRGRIDKHYLAAKYNINPEALDMLEYMVQLYVIEGDSDHYNNVISFIENNDIKEIEDYKYVQTKIDIENFIDYNITQIFIRNTDWPGNNNLFWRVNSNLSEGSISDGKWRWILFDTDFGFGLSGGANAVAHNTLLFAIAEGTTVWPNPEWSTFLLRSLLQNEHFRIAFLNRFADLLNTYFREERVISVIDEIKAYLESDFQNHIDRWGFIASLAEWEVKTDVMRSFAVNRPAYQKQHLKSFFGIDKMDLLSLNVEEAGSGIIQVNSIMLCESTPGIDDPVFPWSGEYFDKTPIKIHAIANPGYKFSHWKGVPDSIKSMREIEIIPESDLSITAVFKEAPLIQLIHHWHFNQLDDKEHTQVKADCSKTDQVGVITYPGTGSGYMDMVKNGTTINLREGTTEGNALRVRNPSKERKLIFHLPTNGYEDVVLSYAASRTSNGAEFQDIYYRTEEDGQWNLIKERNLIIESYYKISVDFTDIEEVNNNPDFAVKIRFTGEKAMNSSGNNRFDNVVLEGFPVKKESTNLSQSKVKYHLNIYPNPATNHINIISAELVQKISLMNLNGRVIKTIYPLSYKSEINISNVSAGIYLLMVETSNAISTKKIVIDRD
ncbi:CotH kinase family protein [Alkalitalea saponilacus]|uniref:Por secretion system C-terminal sorting domain-containing protein n=1 Tax=Alkalitalea saponilacus TaxID=889453 RepID=A0A1T5FK41_9BACT|nr:CotH kinase family protein [Alkalitalea saponilacus]ASB49424.1 hypothetical protein CDL62_09885 [Alkalitalea saponilacus]SKB96533.1 Por secretion system C-terminal sorting domain-containing protein [Alkalitalea saponilacus]